MIRVFVNGANGRMGVEACRAIEADPDLELVGQGRRGDDLALALRESKAEVAVDLTTAEVGFECAKTIIAAGVVPVIGTSGFTDAEVVELQKLAKAKGIGGLVVPNFAIGVVLLMKFAAEAAKYMSRVEILEAHHDKKADSPSGTAVRTAELMAASMGHTLDSLPDKQIIPGARGADISGIKIHSMRMPGVVAQQEVRFGDEAQTLTLAHSSIHRSSFMPGICLACKKGPELNELVNGLEHVLN